MYKKEERKPTEDLCILVVSTNDDGHYYGNSHTYNVRPIVFYGGVVQGAIGSGLTKKGLIERIAKDHQLDFEEAMSIISK